MKEAFIRISPYHIGWNCPKGSGSDPLHGKDPDAVLGRIIKMLAASAKVDGEEWSFRISRISA